MASLTSEKEPAFTPFSKADRIRQLNDIDKSITTLLHSAGLALQTLSPSKAQSSLAAGQSKRDAFQEASNTYLCTLQSVDVRLRRQIYGLEEGDIIPADKGKTKGAEGQEPTLGGMNALVAGQGAGAKEDTQIPVGEGGTGKLDIGWLNSRGLKVQSQIEAELWKKARNFLEGIEKTAEDEKPGSDDAQMDMES